MSIVNRRNAFLGWAAWQVAKRVLARKAKAALPGVEAGSGRPNRAAIAALVALAAGAVWFWRSRDGGDEESPDLWTPGSE